MTELPDIEPALTPGATVHLINGHCHMVLESYDEVMRLLDEAEPHAFVDFQTFRDFGEPGKPDHEPLRVSIQPIGVINVSEITDRLWKRHQRAVKDEAEQMQQHGPHIAIFPGFGR